MNRLPRPPLPDKIEIEMPENGPVKYWGEYAIRPNKPRTRRHLFRVMLRWLFRRRLKAADFSGVQAPPGKVRSPIPELRAQEILETRPMTNAVTTYADGLLTVAHVLYRDFYWYELLGLWVLGCDPAFEKKPSI
jgi:hypothetical protein